MLINTGSWYQILLKRKGEEIIVPQPPIEDFKVTNDLLDMYLTLSAEHIKFDPEFIFYVKNDSINIGDMIFSVENIKLSPRILLNVESANKVPEIMFAVNNMN